MKILAIDDERLSLNRLVEVLEKLVPNAQIVPLRRYDDFMEYREKSDFDAAFIDIELGNRTGIELAAELKKYSPQCSIIFVTSYSEYAFDALKIRPIGYVMKPFTEEEIMEELDQLRFVPENLSEAEKLRVQTFGNFMLFTPDGQTVRFSRSISKEIFAYLVDKRGEFVTTRNIACDVLGTEEFDTTVSKKISQYIADLIKDLKKVGSDRAIIKSTRRISVDPKKINCDLTKLLSGDIRAINTFKGEYMIDYSWAQSGSTADLLRGAS